MRAVITGRDHDRQIGARLAQLQSECIAAAVWQSDVDHREDERLIARRDLARGLGRRDLDRLIAELFERIHRECGDEHLVLHEQYLSACAHSRLLRVEPGELHFLNLQSTPAATSQELGIAQPWFASNRQGVGTRYPAKCRLQVSATSVT